MLLINCLFRANGCAVLLSNKRRDAGRSKYWIKNIVRTNLARDDTAFNCVIQTEDEQGVVGVRLNKDIVQVWIFADRPTGSLYVVIFCSCCNSRIGRSACVTALSLQGPLA
eukprot:GHRR01004488.1.p1 GENE.GHRR01004488.1~~GHRR01004488.1.p1  ORF type:complete len:111 (+),score=21.03 GHRR01004488.1:416-748(+)